MKGKKLKITTTSNNTATVDDKVIYKTQNTRKILRSKIIRENPKNKKAQIKISILHEKKDRSGWSQIKGKPLNKFEAGEIGKLNLDSKTTLELYECLKALYTTAQDGNIHHGESDLVVIPADKLTEVPEEVSDFIQKSPKSLMNIINGLSKNDLKNLIEGTTRDFRKQSLQKFKEILSNPSLEEKDWHNFFKENQWIFGYGLSYHFLSSVTNEPHVGGSDVFGGGGNKSDFLQSTKGEIGFTVLVEIKKPATPLIHERGQYRNNTYICGKEIVGGVAQLRSYARRWETEGSRLEQNRERLESRNIFTIQPKKILIAGNLSTLNDSAKRESFELFRRNQVDIEILTFDELFKRTGFICK